MAREQPFSRRAAIRFSSLLLGGILAVSIYDWYDPGAKPASNSITSQYVEPSGLEDRRYAISNATLVRRDDYSCGPKKPVAMAHAVVAAATVAMDRPTVALDVFRTAMLRPSVEKMPKSRAHNVR